MYGFLITRGIPMEETPLEKAQILSYENIRFYYNPLPKFENDHLFYEDDEKIVLLDGVILNNHELMDARDCQGWRETLDLLVQENPRTFQKELRGSFCGALLQKGTGDLMLFTNQSGEKTVYYTQQAGFFAAASHNNILTAVLKRQGVPVEPDIQAHRELLATAAILHGGTPFRNIRRLNAGKYLLEKEGRCEELRYHMFRNLPEHDLTLEACVEELDKRFRKAVDRIFAKNKEYGYQGECDLSGGLDGRMATWVAHDLGYGNVLNVCYSQRGSIDHVVSQKIAKDLKNDYYFLPLDSGDFLFDIDEMVDKFGGQVTFFVCTGADRCMKEVAARGIGLCATGLSAGAYEATYAPTGAHTPPGDILFRYSRVIPFAVPKEYAEGYENYEQMNLYEEDALVMMSSALVRQQTCEVVSPYVDVDFLDFAYRVPLKWRTHRCLATTWIVTKYPEAAKYLWQKTRKPVDKSHYHQFYFPKLAGDVSRFVRRCFNKAGRTLNLPIQLTLNDEMNPFDLWFRTNPRLRDFAARYYAENIDRVQDPHLKADVRMTYEKGGASDKLQALNLLAVYKRYF